MSDKMNSVNRMIKRITSLAAKIWPYCRRKKNTDTTSHKCNIYTIFIFIFISFLSLTHMLHKLAQLHADICNSSLCYQHNIPLFPSPYTHKHNTFSITLMITIEMNRKTNCLMYQVDHSTHWLRPIMNIDSRMRVSFSSTSSYREIIL